MSNGAWRATLGLGALWLVAPTTGAVSLGKLEVRSPAGAALEARIPVLARKDESPSGACFSLAPRGAVPLRGASLELRHSAHGANLFVRTREAVGEGATFAIAIACPGATASATSVEYAVRFGPGAAHRLPVVTRFAAREGDSLASLAHAIFPNDASIRARYLGAMRAENGSLAALGDEQPLPMGTTVALPDLHAFAATVPPARASKPPRVAAARRAPLVAAGAGESRAATKTAAAKPAAPPRAPRSARAASSVPDPAAAAEPSGGGFRLRLSAPVLDLSPSKGMDERKRAELRERMRVLEADDRTASMLALRENIRRLEAQVNALKLELKLAAMPASLPARPVASQAPKAQPATTAVPPAAAPKVEAPKVEAPKVEAPKVEAPKVEAPKPATTRTAKATPPEHRKPNVIPRASGDEPWYSNAAWWLRLLLVPLAGLLGLRYFARRRSGEIPDAGGFVEGIPPDVATTQPGMQKVREEPAAPEAPAEETAYEAATRVPAEDNMELRGRYMQERFPEIVNGAVMLEDPRSIVKGARLLYEDGAVARAVELLQFAIERDPDAMPPWLALFEIFRLQRLTGEFAELSRRFGERHGASEEWRKVRALGRSLDPANPLYEGGESGAPVDPEAEGWLRTPGDDARRALAGELRSRLMAAASVSDADLAPDPTPALRKAEVFSVA